MSSSKVPMPSSITTNLISYYRLEGNANDSHGAINGTKGADCLIGSDYGKISQGAYFDGSSTTSVIGFGTQRHVGDTTTARSWSFWAKPTESLSRSMWDSLRDGEIYLRTGASSSNVRWRVIVKLGSTYYSTAYSPLMYLNKWYHCAASYDVSGKVIKAYLNGYLFSTTSLPVGNMSAASQQTRFGANVQSTPGELFKGCLDELAIWKKVLTDYEVWALYNRGRGTTYPLV
jgi:hypothetical protein